MKTIGQTSSGKPIYAAFQLHRNFDGWTADDHADAAEAHRGAVRSDIKTNVSMHENSAALHDEEMQRIYRAVEKLGLAPAGKKKSHAQLDREIATVLAGRRTAPRRSHSTRKGDPRSGSSWKQIAEDYKRRAKSAKAAGGKVTRYPYGAILILPTKDSDEYYYEDWQADELIDSTKRDYEALLEHISLEDLLLAQSQEW